MRIFWWLFFLDLKPIKRGFRNAGSSDAINLDRQFHTHPRGTQSKDKKNRTRQNKKYKLHQLTFHVDLDGRPQDGRVEVRRLARQLGVDVRPAEGLDREVVVRDLEAGVLVLARPGGRRQRSVVAVPRHPGPRLACR